MKHRCLRVSAIRHPNGPPFAYCQTCKYVVVRFCDQWFHLAQEAPSLPEAGKVPP